MSESNDGEVVKKKYGPYKWLVLLGSLSLLAVVLFMLSRLPVRRAIGDFTYWRLNSDGPALIAGSFGLPEQDGSTDVYRFRTDKPFSTIRLLVDGEEQWAHVLGEGVRTQEAGASKWYPTSDNLESEALDEIEVRAYTSGNTLTLEIALSYMEDGTGWGRAFPHTFSCPMSPCYYRTEFPSRFLHLNGETLVLGVAPQALVGEVYQDAPSIRVVVE